VFGSTRLARRAGKKPAVNATPTTTSSVATTATASAS
jgi:hypothetical protein